MTEADKDLVLFKIQPEFNSGRIVTLDAVWSKPHFSCSRCPELIQVMRGGFELRYGNNSFPAAKGDILLVPEGTMHCDVFDPDKPPPTLFYVSFGWDCCRDFFRVVDNPGLRRLPAAALMSVHRLLDEIRLATGSSELDRLYESARLHLLLLTLYRALRQSDVEETLARRRHAALVADAKAYLEGHYTEPLTLSELARELGVSPFFLSRVFSGETGGLLFEELNDIRLRKAMELLRSGRHTHSQIAELTGFSSGKYFAAAFKRRFGRPPSRCQDGGSCPSGLRKAFSKDV